MSTSRYINDDTVKTKMGFKDLGKQMWPFLRHHKAKLALIALVVLLFVAVGRSLPLLFGYAVDEGLNKQNLNLIYWVAGIYLFLEIMRSTLAFMQTYFSAKLGNRVLFDVREKVISHVQRLPASFFDRNPIGRTVTRVTNDVFALGELFNQGFTAIVVNIIEMISMIVALTFLSPTLTFASLLGAPILLWYSLKVSAKIRALFKTSKKELAAINAYTAESINGMKVVQLFHLGEHRRKRFDERSQHYFNTQVGTVESFARMWPMFGFFNAFNVAVALAVAAFYLDALGMTIGQLSAFVLLLRGFFKPIRTIIERYNQFQNSLASAERIFTLLDEPEEPQQGETLPVERLAGQVEFRDLSFKYSADQNWVLKDINVTINPGESVALVGRTGSGKSTFISLLQKMYSYSHGEILIDEQPVSQLAPRSLRQRVGVVQQDPFIFRGTIRENVQLGNSNISQDQVLAALKMANCEPLLRRFKEGIDGKLEERGANLSTGEKQLIAFARILAFDPDILILDEATANIDSQSERWIQDAVEKITADRTSIIIAHRLSTVINCDRIIVLDHGKVVEQGSHTELLAKQGAYSELYRAQVKDSAKKKPSTVVPGSLTEDVCNQTML